MNMGNINVVLVMFFAFVLTNINTGVSTNLAVIPSTSTPVTVKDIRDAAYNAACASSNPNFLVSIIHQM